MKILQLISSGGMYGAENMLLNLCRSLTEETDCEVVAGIFHNRHNPHLELAQRLKIEGRVAVEVIPCGGRVDLRSLGIIRRLIEKSRSDIIHCHGYKADLYAFLARPFRSAPLLATAHNWTDKKEIPAAYNRLDKFVLRRFSCVVAVSDGVAEILRASGVAKTKIFRIPNGIDTELFDVAAPTIQAKVRETGGLSIGYIGRLTQEKGCEDFVRSAASIVPRFPGVRFFLAGEGPWRPKLEELVRHLKVEENVVFLGHRDDMPDVYASLDICVLPSFAEGMPMTVLEAMAAGKPVIATPVGEVPRIVEHSVNGLLVTPGDVDELSGAMLHLLHNPTLRRRMGETGRQKAQSSFSAKAMARAYFCLYSQVLKERLSREAIVS